ncbi:PREDICTED: uncharacterized protein LOC104749424 isoform X1 [Camelina sativa]|uniref:Uncharacterized protein LOC104749424 isoform X1 n=2 Tax=Camelina sativa TaxID=90675 RepID=A0ABM0WD37_CAMSA|nr:PREDICTED: uncharacterized protein LOC104749424 isoform X1 [Camelina sativa]
MVRKEDVDFYCGFSRKELQSLCKKYNLPANRSSSDMAESLASFFEKNGLNSVGFGFPGNQHSVATTSRAPADRTWDVRRDSYGKELDKTREDCVQGAVPRSPGFFLGDNTPYQERNGNGGLIDSACAPPYMRTLNEKGPTTNSKRTDSRPEDRMRDVDSGDSASSSSFEFHVSLEEGISLSVDLNFNPSDWINSMRDEVNVCDSMRRRKPPHSDLGINNATECKKQKTSGQDTDGRVMRESSVSPTMKENAHLPSDHHSNGERSLALSSIEPCSRIKEGSDTCKEKKGIDLSIPDSLVPGQIVSSCVESYSKSCCVNPVDLDCVIPPEKKSTSDSIMVAAEKNHPPGDHLIETPGNPSMESFHKVGNSSTVICPRGAGSELSSSEAEAYHSNLPCSPRKTNRSSTISSPEFIIDRESTSCSESFKFRCNGGKNCLPPNTEEQEKSEVLSEQARSE